MDLAKQTHHLSRLTWRLDISDAAAETGKEFKMLDLVEEVVKAQKSEMNWNLVSQEKSLESDLLDAAYLDISL